MFYVYELRDPKNGVAFYVGKGQGDRAYQHQREVLNGKAINNPAKIAKIKEILDRGEQVEVVVVAEYAFEEDALDHEFHLIDTNLTLTNVMPGGASNGKQSELSIAASNVARLKKLCIDLERCKTKLYRKASVPPAKKTVSKGVIERLERSSSPAAKKNMKEIAEWLESNTIKMMPYKPRHGPEYMRREGLRGRLTEADGIDGKRLAQLTRRLDRAKNLYTEAEKHLIALRKKAQQKRAVMV